MFWAVHGPPRSVGCPKPGDRSSAAVLTQPGWGRHLSRVFRTISEVVVPFYGEARVNRAEYRGPTRYIEHPAPIRQGTGTASRGRCRLRWWLARRTCRRGTSLEAERTGSCCFTRRARGRARWWRTTGAGTVPSGARLALEVCLVHVPGMGRGITGDHPSRAPDFWPFASVEGHLVAKPPRSQRRRQKRSRSPDISGRRSTWVRYRRAATSGGSAAEMGPQTWRTSSSSRTDRCHLGRMGTQLAHRHTGRRPAAPGTQYPPRGRRTSCYDLERCSRGHRLRSAQSRDRGLGREGPPGTPRPPERGWLSSVQSTITRKSPSSRSICKEPRLDGSASARSCPKWRTPGGSCPPAPAPIASRQTCSSRCEITPSLR